MARRLLILATVLVGTALLPGQSLAAGGTLTDGTGDASGGAPDITAVGVDESEGTVTFTLSVAYLATLGASHRYEVRINSDNDAQTGNNGVDQVLVLHGPNQQVSHWRWNGSAFELAPVSGLSGTASAPFRLTISSASLGNPAAITVYARSLELTTQGRDDAPNSGVFGVTFRTPQTQPAQPGQPGNPTPPGPPSGPPGLGSPPALPSLPSPAGPGQPSTPPNQPTNPGPARPSEPSTQPKQPAATPAALSAAKLAVVRRGGRDVLTASMTFRRPIAGRAVVSCKGTLAGAPLLLKRSVSGRTVSCSTAVGRAAAGPVRIRMSVTIGRKTFVRVLRGTLRAG